MKREDPEHSVWKALCRRPALCLTMAVSLLGTGCATYEKTGTLVGAGIGLAACELAYKNQSGRKKNACRVLAASVSAFAGSRIGALLDDRDRQIAEEASRRAIAEREAAVQRALSERNAEIERRQRAELEAARSAAERAQAQTRALQAQQAAREQAQAQVRTSESAATWRGAYGNSGTSQAVGTVVVAGRSGCQSVREVAYIQGKEVRQQATYCQRNDGGGLERVATA